METTLIIYIGIINLGSTNALRHHQVYNNNIILDKSDVIFTSNSFFCKNQQRHKGNVISVTS
jgi:hypothetical protein